MDFYNKLRLRNALIGLMPWAGDIADTLAVFFHSSNWRKQGLRPPLPSEIKRCIIKAEALRIGAKVFVETGTFMGDTPWLFRRFFGEIHSVEIEPHLAAIAATRFRRYPHIHIYRGDSAKILREVGPTINDTALFWLDGHYSGGITGKGETECPIWMELDCIFETVFGRFSLMIDDARYFGANPDYPKISDLQERLLKLRPEYLFRVENDIIFFSPAGE
jgi:hypothetical protein